MEITPLGDSALILRVRDRFDDAPGKTLDEVMRIFHWLESSKIPGVSELAPAYTTIAVFFDPLQVPEACEDPDQIFASLKERIHAAVAGITEPGHNKRAKRRFVEIPVCYDPEFAFDLDDV